MFIRIIILIFLLFISFGKNLTAWFIWDLYQVYDDTDKKVLLESGYKMYEFNATSKEEEGSSYIIKHDVFYDWFRAHLVISEMSMDRSQKLEIGDYLKINYSPLIFKKKVNGVSYTISETHLGKLNFTISRKSSPGSRGSEVTEDNSTILMGARYEKKVDKIDLSLIRFNNLKFGLSFANQHTEKYNNITSGIFELNSDKTSISPKLYLWIGDSDTSDGNGGQIFEIKFICYDTDGNIIKDIYFHTPASSSDPDNESDYLYYNTGSLDNDHRFADMSASIIYALPVPLNTKKIFLIIKTGGIEKLIKVSSDNLHYITIDNSLLPDNDYCNLIITENSFSYDNSISLGSSSTYDDNATTTSINLTVKDIVSDNNYVVSGNTAAGMDFKSDITFPYIGKFKVEGLMAFSRERRLYYTGVKNSDGYAYRYKVSYPFNIKSSYFEVGTIQWWMDNKYNASFSVDSRKNYNSIEFYPEKSGSGVPLGKEIDFNYDGIPDYTEGFYAIDSEQPIFIMGDDKNYNGILDKFEFSDIPDYGMYINQRGCEYYIWFSPFIEIEMQAGIYETKEYIGVRTLKSFYYKFSYEKNFSGIIFLGFYNISSYVKKDLWTEDKGLVDGLDNDMDGYIDESDEVDSVISNQGFYDRSFVNRNLINITLARLKGGIGAKFNIGSYYVNDFKNSKKKLLIGNSGLIDYKKEFFNITFRPFFKVTTLFNNESPYNLVAYYQSYWERNYGVILSYLLIKKWVIKFGYINQFYNFAINQFDTKGNILLFELVGKPILSGRNMVAKVGFERTKSKNELRGDQSESNFFVKLFFRM